MSIISGTTRDFIKVNSSFNIPDDNVIYANKSAYAISDRDVNWNKPKINLNFAKEDIRSPFKFTQSPKTTQYQLQAQALLAETDRKLYNEERYAKIGFAPPNNFTYKLPEVKGVKVMDIFQEGSPSLMSSPISSAYSMDTDTENFVNTMFPEKRQSDSGIKVSSSPRQELSQMEISPKPTRKSPMISPRNSPMSVSSGKLSPMSVSSDKSVPVLRLPQPTIPPRRAPSTVILFGDKKTVSLPDTDKMFKNPVKTYTIESSNQQLLEGGKDAKFRSVLMDASKDSNKLKGLLEGDPARIRKYPSAGKQLSKTKTDQNLDGVIPNKKFKSR